MVCPRGIQEGFSEEVTTKSRRMIMIIKMKLANTDLAPIICQGLSHALQPFTHVTFPITLQGR